MPGAIVLEVLVVLTCGVDTGNELTKKISMTSQIRMILCLQNKVAHNVSE